MKNRSGIIGPLAAMLFAVLLVPTKYTYIYETYFPSAISPVWVLGGMILILISVDVIRRGKIPHIPEMLWVPYAGLVGLMLVSLSFTPNVDYGLSKVLEFATITTLACFAPFFLFINQQNIRSFVYTIVVIGIFLAVFLLLAAPYSHSIHFQTKLGSNYLAIQHMSGLAALIVLYYFLLKKQSIGRAMWWFFVLAVLTTGIIYSGGKAPVLTFLLALISMALVTIQFKSGATLSSLNKRILSFPLLVFAIGACAFLVLSSTQNIGERVRTEQRIKRADLSKRGTCAICEKTRFDPSIPRPLFWEDYRLTLTMRSDNDDSIGVVFRYHDLQNYYRFSWNRELACRRLVRCEGGIFSLLAEDSVPYLTGRTYRVEIVARGADLEISIDDNLIFAVTDTTFPRGTIALYCWGNQASYFDDVRVTDLSSGAELLCCDFDDGVRTGWKIVDEGDISAPSEWVVKEEILLQKSNIASLPPEREGWNTAKTRKLDSAALYWRFRKLLRKGHYSQVERIGNVKTALRLFYDHPLLGVGIGGFSVYAYKIEGVERFKYPHNIVLELLCELGLVGLLLFFVIIFFAFKTLISLHRRQEIVAIAFLSLLIFTFLNSMTSQHIANPALFAFIGSSFAIASTSKEQYR